jgi:hypothetical protein
MKEIHLFDLPEELYVKLDTGFFRHLFDNLKRKYGKWCNLAKILNTHPTNVYGWKSGRILFSIKILKILCYLTGLEELEVEKFVEFLKFRGGYINNPKLPIIVSEDFGLILAATLGDGGVSRNGYTIHYTNKSTVLVDSFLASVRSVFGDVRIISDKVRNIDNVRMVRLSGVLGRILVKTFKVPLGKKPQFDYNFPNIILESDDKVKSRFLRRLFDDEGNVNKTTIESGKVKNQVPARLKDLTTLLKTFGIRCCNPKKVRERSYFRNKNELVVVEDWELGVSDRKSLELFEKNIGFKLEYKANLLRKALSSYKIWETPKNESMNFFLENSKVLNKEFTSKELAQKTGRSSHRTNIVLRKLVKQGLLNRKCLKCDFGNGQLYVYNVIK